MNKRGKIKHFVRLALLLQFIMQSGSRGPISSMKHPASAQTRNAEFGPDTMQGVKFLRPGGHWVANISQQLLY